MDRAGMNTIIKKFQVEKSRIGFLKFIFEAHDGLGVLTTLDPGTGLVQFAIAPGCLCDVEAILDDLKKDVKINEV
jgi:hypothetical protein